MVPALIPAPGLIGFGNVGGKLAASLLRNGVDLTVRDLDRDVARPFLRRGRALGESPAQMIDDEPEAPGYEVVPMGRS